MKVLAKEIKTIKIYELAAIAFASAYCISGTIILICRHAF